MQSFKTSPEGVRLIKRFEGCELNAYQPGEGQNWTIGWGQEGRMPDGREIVEGMTITQREADDALMYFLLNVAEPLTRKHFVCRTQAEFDACVSFVYNIRHDRLERGDYTLPSLVNDLHRDTSAIISKWVQYRNPGSEFEQGLYRRRLAELCRFFGYPWVDALAAVLRRTPAGVDMTDPNHVLDLAEVRAEREKPAPAPAKPVSTEPLPEAKPAPPVAPNVDPAAPPKPMESSKTHKGLSKKESGQEAVIVGTGVAGAGTITAIIREVTAGMRDVQAATQEVTTVLAGMTLGQIVILLGAGLIAVGGWRIWVGSNMAYEGRLEATQPKV